MTNDYADLFAEAEKQSQPQACRVSRAIEFLTDDQKSDLERAFKTPKITGAAIARALYVMVGTQLYDNYGIEDIKPKTAQRHRRGECSCERTT